MSDYVLAYANPDTPLEIQLYPPRGLSVAHMCVASRVLEREGDKAYTSSVSVWAQGAGLVLDGVEFPGTLMLALVTVGRDVSVDLGSGVPPCAAMLWVAADFLRTRARGLWGRHFAEQDQMATQGQRPSGLVVGRGGQVR